MKLTHLISYAILSLSGVQAATLNGPCTGAGGAPGTCISTSSCTKAGGKYISNACPGLPADIKCCSKTSCGNGGNCRFTSACSSRNTQAGLCPGPSSFQCCLPKASGGGKFPPPKIPAVGRCKKTAVDGAKKIVAAHPGKVREIFCIRDCPCPSNSEHCCGLATDMMCTSVAGKRDRDAFGRSMAEWVMNNRKALNLKYVIWGQKIWNPSRDKVAPWTSWRQMEDRGSITQNHCWNIPVNNNKTGLLDK
ncbi:D-alanyl-d-alanine carboxypeptidase [Trichophyton interdigitale]|uniref:D-alanyl-d-alanine carboxypeptidase n=2 Tax=Trichophyton interdigitale TaxID=101480 RepID=A0A9P4YL66_9EURO|nr:hypothetical protein H101_00978 [Trichophyton interdigitale H6]KAF3898753.1 D-alanyl-d-alanine carboxypeptidase [Trichophyton interdigitale]KAF3900654.1 D-alanyl-d-alanine carboxypeptidase [Trichophyton interdigitale]KAG8211461.1 D-alanyl-d-alanine carboxypeptidase [Trichophyton interdigitale]KDB22035.1 hypothetical protein H109_06046 [Trichophyton interdigitale MR816]